MTTIIDEPLTPDEARLVAKAVTGEKWHLKDGPIPALGRGTVASFWWPKFGGYAAQQLQAFALLTWINDRLDRLPEFCEGENIRLHYQNKMLEAFRLRKINDLQRIVLDLR